MLQKMRDKAQGWLTWLIVLVISLMFALWGVSYYLTDMTNSQTSIGKVNGVALTQTSWDRLYQQMSSQQNPEQPINSAALRQQALNALIEQQVLLQAAQSAGITISESEIQQALYMAPELQVDGKFSVARYQQLLQNLNMTSAEFYQQMVTTALINEYRLGLMLSEFVTPSEIEQFTALMFQERSFGYFLVPSQKYLAQVKITDAQAQQYYQSHQSQYMSPEQVSLQYLELSVAALQKNIQISDAEAQTYYQQNQASFKLPEQRQLSQILIQLPKSAKPDAVSAAEAKALQLEQQLQAGQSFSQLATQVSQDPISAQQGGSLGWIKPGDLPKVLETAAFSLQQVGQITPPVRTEYGLQIIRLDAIQPAQQQSYAQVKAQIIQQLQLQRAQEKFAKLGNRLANITFENPDSLTEAAKEVGLTIQTTPAFSKQGGTGIAANPKVIQAAFSDSVLLQGNNSDVINVSNGDAVVIRALQVTQPQLMPFATVKAKIVQILAQQAADQQAQQVAANMLKNLQQKLDPQTVANQYQLKWHVESKIRRDDKKLNPALIQAVFNQSIPSATVPVLAMVPVPDQGYAVLQLTTVTPGKLNASVEKLYNRILKNLLAQQAYQSYYQGLKSQAKIELSQ